ncbi:MAG: phage terminase large subunit family protein, partial [Arenicella sp.]|nr:phage terminase large subunit family protein [Arenicella sp.]
MSKHYYLPPELSENPGIYNFDNVPYFWGIAYAFDNPSIKEIYLRKASQIGWTIFFIGFILKRVKEDPCNMLLMFAKDGAGRDFHDEKFVPCIKSCVPVSKLINVSGSRQTGQRTNFKKFRGGFIRLFGSNSISNLKSTTAPFVGVEEPDDANDNVSNQGKAITQIPERMKRWEKRKFVMGGTPSIKGLSTIDSCLEKTDQRVLPITCHNCGQQHVMEWGNVRWQDDPKKKEHPVYGFSNPETAVYVCPHCEVEWNDKQRRRNIFDTVVQARDSGDPWCGWVSTAECSPERVGFQELNELYVCIPGTNLSHLVEDFIEAEREAANGDFSGRITFENNKLARSYEFKGKNATAEALRAAAKDYPEWIVPQGGLIINVGIDVQDNRVALIFRASGRNEESWLLWWGEVYASHSCVDPKDPIWAEMEQLVFGPIQHQNGRNMYVSGISIDSGDGDTNDAVYKWVRKMKKRHTQVKVMAIKGSTDQVDT